jgi:hypothetical protein
LNKKTLLIITIPIIAIIVAAIVLIVPWGTSKPTVKISSAYNVTKDQTFIVNVTVNEVENLFKWQISLGWDPEIIQITTGDTNGLSQNIRGVTTYYNIYEGPFLKSVRATRFLYHTINNTAGVILSLADGFSTAGTDTASGSGVLATINFTCVKTGTTAINITGPSAEGHSYLLDQTLADMLHEDENGLVTDQPPEAAASMVTFIIRACCNRYQNKTCSASNK